MSLCLALEVYVEAVFGRKTTKFGGRNEADRRRRPMVVEGETASWKQTGSGI